MPITVTSSAFSAGQPVPRKHTGEGPDVSPALAWSGLPPGTQEIALIVDDPDAPRKDPWVHWVFYKIPPSAMGLPEGVPRLERVKVPEGSIQGRNDFGHPGYGGPMPPPGHGVHHYHFKVYALGVPLHLAPGATKAQLLEAMKAKILAEGELIGTYKR